MLGATQRPPAQGLRTGVRGNGTPWMYAGKRRTARGVGRATASFGIGSNLGGVRGEGRRKRQFGPRTRPDRTRAGLSASHLVAANGKTPITPSANRHPTIVARIKRATEHGECRGAASGSSWDSTATAAPKKGSSLDPHLPHISGLQRLCSPRAPDDRRGVSLLNWNVGLDYTARRLNCQSANAFVEPRQMCAPRFRNAPSKTEPRVPSHPPANRASSRPRSAPSTIA